MQHDFILLDRSGSMASMWAEALSAVNAYVKKLADDKVDTGVTLAVFDSNGILDFKVVRDRIIPGTWNPVTNADAEPRGTTPLNDAAGRIVALAEACDYDKVAIIIMTDGHENASKEYSVQQIKAKLDACRAKNWQVIFLGADFDNASQATGYGAMPANFAQSSKKNLVGAMSATASMRGNYGLTGQAMNFTEDQKAALKRK